MAAGGQGDDDELITAINVTPLVDIVLVLLIILMVTASYIVSQSIPMDLPNADTGEDSEPSTFRVSLDETGQLFVGTEESDWEHLRVQARAFASSEAEPRAVIAADRRVSHGQFIRIVDVLRGAGIMRYAINVSPQDLEDEEP